MAGWRPRPAVGVAAGIHLAAPALALASPESWPYALGAVAGSHALLALLGLWPRSQVLGRTLVRLPPGGREGRVALTFDDGPDPEVTPALLDQLDLAGARASFFLVGERARAHPALVREIARRGHLVENHTMRHLPYFACLGLGALRRELAEAQEVLAALAGRAPRLARAPAGLRSPLVDPVLAGLGLEHASWARRGFDTRCADPARVLRGLLRGLRPGDVLMLHDGRCARTAEGRPVVLEVVPDLLAALGARGLRPVPLSPDPGRGPDAAYGPDPVCAAPAAAAVARGSPA